MENRFFLLHFNEQGEIVRLFDKRTRREVVPAGERANRFQLFQDGPERESAWNIHSTFDMREYAFEGTSSVTVLDQGPVRASLRVSRQHRDTHITQDIVLYDKAPRIDFITRVDWRERQVLLKAVFPLAVHSQRASYEIQFGAIERPTHRNTSWDQEKFEVPCQRWADLSEAGYGVSLLNDCKYGCDIRDNVMRLSLLRGPEWPDPEADLGEHEFTYSLFPHEGSWHEAGTVQAAWELNTPLLAYGMRRSSGSGGESTGLPYAPPSQSLLTVKGSVLLETIKRAEDGKGWIVRFYEPHGARGRAEIEFSGKLKIVGECNHIEEPVGAVDHSESGFAFDFLPFQIRTFRLDIGGR
jgi:alpha-mannosidase